jgi:hypothetical protein
MTNGFFSQFSEAQMKSQYRANYETLKWMLEKAIRTGKKVNNYTEDQLRANVAKYAVLAGLN